MKCWLHSKKKKKEKIYSTATANTPLGKAVLKTVVKPGHLCPYCPRQMLGRGLVRRGKASVALGWVKLQCLGKSSMVSLKVVQKRECLQAYDICIVFPGDPAQYFTHKFWKQLPYNIDKQLNYLFQNIKKKIIQMVLKGYWESGRLGYILVLSLNGCLIV